MTTQPSLKRPKCFLQIDVKLRNHREDIQLQWKLHNISAKHRINLRLLEQEREFVLKEHKRLLHLKVCEPRATVNNTMRDIMEVRMVKNDPQESRTSKSAPTFKVLTSARGEDDKGPRFAKSAIISGKQCDSSLQMLMTEKLKASKSGQLSFLQLKDLALIDSISEKELMQQEEYYRWYIATLKQLQREKLRQKIKCFLDTIEHI